MPPYSASKDPNATLDYGWDWSQWLTEVEDTISDSVWIVPAGLTLESDSHTTTHTTVWLSGGTAGQSYAITNRITTSGGRTDDRSFTLRCMER